MHHFRWQGGTDPPNQNPADAFADTSYCRVLFTFDSLLIACSMHERLVYMTLDWRVVGRAAAAAA